MSSHHNHPKNLLRAGMKVSLSTTQKDSESRNIELIISQAANFSSAVRIRRSGMNRMMMEIMMELQLNSESIKTIYRAMPPIELGGDSSKQAPTTSQTEKCQMTSFGKSERF